MTDINAKKELIDHY